MRAHPWIAALCVFAFFSLSALPAGAGFRDSVPYTPEKRNEGDLLLGLSGSHYRSSKNFDSSGASQALQGSASIFHSNGSIFAEYGIRGNFSLLAALSAANTTLNASFPTLARRSNAGPESLEVGGRFSLPDAPVNVFADASVEVPLYPRPPASSWSSPSNASPAPLGDGATLFQLASTLEMPLTARTLLGARLGYTHRTAGFSAYFPYAAYVKLLKQEGYFARLGLRGDLHAIDDQHSNSDGSAERSQSLIAGSQIFNALNPRYAALDAAAGVYLNPSIDFAIGYQREFSGKSVSFGNLFLAALTFHFNQDKGAAPSKQGAGSNRGFFQYTGFAKVIRVNNAERLILIDRGRNEGVRPGDLMDVFSTEGSALGRARVIESGPTRSKLEVLEVFPTGKDSEGNEVPIREGFVVRKPLP